MLWSVWWVWVVAGFVLGIVEVIVPGFIFLGFAIGAALTGVLIGLGVLASATLPFLLMVFAVLSLIAWLALRMAVGKRPGQVKVWDRDINDNR